MRSAWHYYICLGLGKAPDNIDEAGNPSSMPVVDTPTRLLRRCKARLLSQNIFFTGRADQQQVVQLLADFEDAALRRADSRARELETKLAEAPALAARLAARPIRA